MAPKILALADLHLTENPTDQYRHDFMDALPAILERRQIDALAILGDLTQEKDRHPAQLVNKVVHQLDAVAKIVPVLILEGNHDFQNEGFPFFAFVNRIPNIEWVGRITHGAALKGRNFRSIFNGCLFLPHTRNYARDWADIIKPPKGVLGFESYRAVFCHNTFNGAEVGWGRKLDGIPLDIFPKKAKVFAGDIHVPQTLGPVTYVGAPYTINFGDDYEPRMIIIEDHAWHSVKLGGFPQKRLIEVDDLADLLKVKGVKEGDIIKVRIGQDDMGNWGSIHRDILEWGADHGLIIHRAEPVMSHRVVNKRIRVRASAASAISDAELVKTYGKRHTLEQPVIKIGLELLK